nr:ATP synthase F0 subunit 8 [Donacia flemola]
MPQMAPMNWTLIMMYFITMFILFNIMNYYNFLYKFKFMKLNKKFKKLNWKW